MPEHHLTTYKFLTYDQKSWYLFLSNDFRNIYNQNVYPEMQVADEVAWKLRYCCEKAVVIYIETLNF